MPTAQSPLLVGRQGDVYRLLSSCCRVRTGPGSFAAGVLLGSHCFLTGDLPVCLCGWLGVGTGWKVKHMALVAVHASPVVIKDRKLQFLYAILH